MVMHIFAENSISSSHAIYAVLLSYKDAVASAYCNMSALDALEGSEHLS